MKLSELTPQTEADRLVGNPEAMKILGIAHSTYWDKVAKDPDYPAPMIIGSQERRWVSEIRAYAERKRRVASDTPRAA